jgi:hypothetical protein
MMEIFSPEEDQGYRRGFDQGFFVALTMLGLDNKCIQFLSIKKRLVSWRYSRECDCAPHPTPTEEEKEELKRMLAYYS